MGTDRNVIDLANVGNARDRPLSSTEVQDKTK
jgi:hypothetical protein